MGGTCVNARARPRKCVGLCVCKCCRLCVCMCCRLSIGMCCTHACTCTSTCFINAKSGLSLSHEYAHARTDAHDLHVGCACTSSFLCACYTLHMRVLIYTHVCTRTVRALLHTHTHASTPEHKCKRTHRHTCVRMDIHCP